MTAQRSHYSLRKTRAYRADELLAMIDTGPGFGYYWGWLTPQPGGPRP